MLWMLDASINITMEPMRAFVGDMLSDEQRTQGFAVQTFFIGAASIVGSLLPWILTNLLRVPNTAQAGLIPLSVRWAFLHGRPHLHFRGSLDHFFHKRVSAGGV